MLQEQDFPCPPARLLTAIKASAPKLLLFLQRQVGNITKNFNSHFMQPLVSSGEPKEDYKTTFRHTKRLIDPCI
jgi:hypothetical protein